MTDLFSPLALRPSITAKNRIWLAPLTNMQSHQDGTCSEQEARFLGMRADGGFGLVTTCAAFVSQDGKAWPGELGVHDDAMIPGLTRLASRIQDAGSIGSVQLFHGGHRADPSVSGIPPWSASSLVEQGVEVAREATLVDIDEAIAAFGAAASRCAKAGFQALELHGAHGYLLSQFLSTTFNRREGAWGGKLAHRARLLREVTRLVRKAAPDVALIVRLSPEDFGQAKGLDLDETLQVAKWLLEDGVDVLHLSLWRAAHNTTKYPEVHPTAFFRKELGSDAKLVVAGAIWTREEAEAQLALGADAVALGRSAIGNHDGPLRVARGEEVARAPFTAAHLEAEGLSPGFVGYMGKWKGFVA
jgi:2,4-dienoyl-CoA reductase-like NADH-dependent reductase (Old Yellow Enzyme family)